MSSTQKNVSNAARAGAAVPSAPFERSEHYGKGNHVYRRPAGPFDGEPNVLSVIRKAGIEMPTFCYYSDLSVYGACRMCVVEDERGKIETSCSMKPRDGLSIRTNTARLLKHRRMILELLLASHNCSCTTCEKSGDCRLQELAVFAPGAGKNRFFPKKAAALSWTVCSAGNRDGCFLRA